MGIGGGGEGLFHHKNLHSKIKNIQYMWFFARLIYIATPAKAHKTL